MEGKRAGRSEIYGYDRLSNYWKKLLSLTYAVIFAVLAYITYLAIKDEK